LCELEGAFGEQDREAVHDGVAAGAAGAENAVCLKFEPLAADRAGQPAKVVGGKGAVAHGFYLRGAVLL